MMSILCHFLLLLDIKNVFFLKREALAWYSIFRLDFVSKPTSLCLKCAPEKNVLLKSIFLHADNHILMLASDPETSSYAYVLCKGAFEEASPVVISENSEIDGEVLDR